MAAVLVDCAVPLAAQDPGLTGGNFSFQASSSTSRNPEPGLVTGLRSPDPAVRRRSLKLLREFGPENAANEIADLSSRDAEWYMRNEAIQALGCIRHPDAATMLLRDVDDRSLHSFVRLAAVRSLRRQQGSAAIPKFRALLNDDDTLVAASAASQLVQLQDS